MRYEATKTINRIVDRDTVMRAVRTRTDSLAKVLKEKPLIVEGFNSSLGGWVQVSQVAFSIQKTNGKTVLTAEVHQRPTWGALILGIIGLFFYVVPGVGVVFWYYLSKSLVQRELWRILEEAGEELNAVTPTAQAAPVDVGSTAGTKVCPCCAETIKSAAVLCRFCGKDLAAG